MKNGKKSRTGSVVLTVALCCVFLAGCWGHSKSPQAWCKIALSGLPEDATQGPLVSQVKSVDALGDKKNKHWVYMKFNGLGLPLYESAKRKISSVEYFGNDFFVFRDKQKKIIFAVSRLSKIKQGYIKAVSRAIVLSLPAATIYLKRSKTPGDVDFWVTVAHRNHIMNRSFVTKMATASRSEVNCLRAGTKDWSALYSLYARSILFDPGVFNSTSDGSTVYRAKSYALIRLRIKKNGFGTARYIISDGQNYLTTITVTGEAFKEVPDVSNLSLSKIMQPAWLKLLAVYMHSHGEKSWNNLKNALKRADIAVQKPEVALRRH